MGVAPLALLAFVPAALVVFSRLSPPYAAAVVMLSSALFLPERVGFDLPLIPPITKHTVGVIATALGCFLWARPRLLRVRLGTLPDVLIVVMVASAWATTFTNRDVFSVGAETFSPMGLRDAVSMTVRNLLMFGVPFYLGRTIYRTPRDLRALMICLVVAGVVYAFLVIWEARMSPQLHRWVYGFLPNDWTKSKRLGGWRPMVFLQSGIAVGTFMVTVAIVAMGFVRARLRVLGLPSLPIAVFLAFALLATRSLAAIAMGLFALPMAALFPRRLLAVTIAAMAAFVMIYPLLRLGGAFPLESVVAAAATVNQERAESLDYRFYNEEIIVDRVRDQVLFGWGGYERYRPDPQTGRKATATDGFWIIQLGSRGLVGFVCTFGLITWPVFLACARVGRIRSQASAMLLLSFAFAIAIRSLDMLPNGLYGLFPYFLSGALYGVLEGPGKPPPRALRGQRQGPRRGPSLDRPDSRGRADPSWPVG